MSKAIALALAGGLAAISCALVSSGNKDPTQMGPEQRTPLGSDHVDTMRSAAAGAWRAGFRSESPSDTSGRAPATEIVTVQKEKTPRLAGAWTTVVQQSQDSLARDIQRELARVGCYDGETNGVWTTSTRHAMKVFMDRVNAVLPMSQPDSVLLALVRSHGAQVCGVSCPAGQDLAHSGRCVPAAVLSRAAKKSEPTTTTWSTTTTVAPALPSTLAEGQMALAGPRPEVNVDALKAGPVQPVPIRAPRMPPEAGRDWRTELWKKQGN